jgi:hypothetical protein
MRVPLAFFRKKYSGDDLNEVTGYWGMVSTRKAPRLYAMIRIFMKPFSLAEDWLVSRFLNPGTIATFSCFNGEKALAESHGALAGAVKITWLVRSLSGIACARSVGGEAQKLLEKS